MSTRTFRYRIARLEGVTVQTKTYIGPFDQIPAGWSMVTRQLVTPSFVHSKPNQRGVA